MAAPFGSWVFSAVLLVLLSCCTGRQNYRTRLPNGHAVPCPPDHDCAGEICVGFGHMACDGGAIEPRRNPFGEAFEKQGLRWTHELCKEDSDGDGFTNGEELGDPCCIWHEGAVVPLWMTEDEWEVTHPGFASSIPSGPVNKSEICNGVGILDAEKFFNPEEEQITVEYIIDEHIIKSVDTIYDDVIFNFPDDRTYDIVGIEPIVDNEEMLHHFIMYSCSNQTDMPGAIAEDSQMLDFCREALYLWGPGNGNYTGPPNAGIRIGKNTKHKAFQLNIHYDNPLLKVGQKDASGVRVHMTPNLRQDEVGIYWVGPIVSVGLIPPGETEVYSSTICQPKIDEGKAPGGVKVFAYAPHMHFLGRRMWTDHLIDPSREEDAQGFVTGLEELEKVGEFSRDDAWRFDVQKYGRITPKTLRNGDYLATICVFDSTDRDDYTTGGLGSYDEMCINFFYYYPAAAGEPNLFCSGPRYFGTSLPKNASSIMDVAKVSKAGMALPLWRRAYLSGEVKCQPTGYRTLDLVSDTRSAGFWGEVQEKCGSPGVTALGSQSDALSALWTCTQECAKILYNALGCALLEDAVEEGGKTLSLFASPLEIVVENNCRSQFAKIYEESKNST